MKKELPEKVRISKFLASYNVGSRREIERMIEDGRIHLNGKVLATPVHFVNKTDSIKLDGKLLFLKNSSKFTNFINQLIVSALRTNKMNEKLFTIYFQKNLKILFLRVGWM